ncbi:hypothetical protein EVAR_58182_1 [Eumeta japonica]|uniref:Uncharacterized protein n=1 Tax=Eumeta variegata TaxID=151549 RepID=A0A4C1YU10_EUMVA|nr:hypothetical protein EVAR_58182_1 [Eumeta japonica]
MDDRLRSKAVNPGVYCGVNVGTNHPLVVCRIRALCQCWRYHAKMVSTELEEIKNGKVKNPNVKLDIGLIFGYRTKLDAVQDIDNAESSTAGRPPHAIDKERKKSVVAY